MPKYIVKNVKTFRGTEGQGFNATLYRDGKKVAFIIDSARGGIYTYEWNDWELSKVDINVSTTISGPYTFKGTPEQKILYEFIETLPKTNFKDENEYFPEGLKITDDRFIASLVDNFISERKMKRLRSKNYLFQVDDEIGGGEFNVIKKQSNITREWVENYIKRNYPNQKYKLLED